MLLIGALIFVIGSIVCVEANSFDILCVGRIIQGIGVGAGLSLARVILRDCYQGTALAIKSSQVGTFVSLTPALAPLLGGILQQHFGYHASFVFMLVYGLLLMCSLFFFKETIQTKTKTLSVRNSLLTYAQLLQNGSFIRFSAISGMAFTAIILYANIMPFIVQNTLHYSARSNGIILLIAALGVSSGAWINSQLVRMVNRISSVVLIKVGLIIFITNGLLMILLTSIFGVYLAFLIPLIFIIAMSCGSIFPMRLRFVFRDKMQYRHSRRSLRCLTNPDFNEH